MQVKKQQLELDMEQWTGSELVKDYDKAVYCHPAYLTCESEIAQSCPTLCDPMDCSLSGSSIHEIFQARALEWDAIAFSDPSQHQSLFQWVNSSHQVAKVLEFQL